MALVVKIFKTLRNNWKKSTFAAVLVTYGYNFGKEKLEGFKLMRVYCEEAKKYGDMTLPTEAKPRHITVILNPAAKNGKGKKLFDTFAAPLFHLSGIKLSVIQTEFEGQAKNLMEVMDNTDAVVIAGGDGTISDAITGLLRRTDGDVAAKRFPLGVIPIGQTNTVAKSLYFNEDSSNTKWIADASMAIIREKFQPIDVMHVESDSGKPIYAIGKIDLGIFRNIKANIPKYWYWGPLKTQMAHVFSSLRTWPNSVDVDLKYTLPCSGCSKCYKRPNDQISQTNVRWWHAFIKPSVNTAQVPTTTDYSTIQNDECGVWKEKKTKTTELTIATKQAFSPGLDNSEPHLQVRIVADDLTRYQFFAEGLNHSKDGKASDDVSFCLQANEIKINPVKTEDEWYSIDSEPFEVKPIIVKLLKKKINFYCTRTE